MVYKWYILPIGGLYATYHLLGEPETTISNGGIFRFQPLGTRGTSRDIRVVATGGSDPHDFGEFGHRPGVDGDGGSIKSYKGGPPTTVDGRNPAPVDR